MNNDHLATICLMAMQLYARMEHQHHVVKGQVETNHLRDAAQMQFAVIQALCLFEAVETAINDISS
jgi:hypothetical protein